jgi:tRNA(fMet)-specific endonuclease VapC
MPLYLLDTNIVSYLLKRTPGGVRDHMEQKPPDSIAISAVTAAELRFWSARRTDQPRFRVHIEDLLLRVPTLPWDASAAAAYGQMKAELFRIGRPLAELDLQIAAHAFALNLTLVTHDAAFRNVPGLRLEDWTVPPV